MSDDTILEESRDRLRRSADAMAHNREEWLDDLRFLSLDQWPAANKRARENDPNGARPCLVLDKCGQHLQQIVNDMRKNAPSLKVRPVDNLSDKETAEVFSGIIRHIEQRSSAEVAYLTAGYYAAAIGIGYFRILTEWEHERGFNQEIAFSRIHNPFSVYYDHMSTEIDGSDAEWASITDRISKDSFERQWPDARTSMINVEGVGDTEGGWFSDEGIRIAEYFYLEKKKEKLLLLEDGSTSWVDKYRESMEAGVENPVIEARDAVRTRCYWCKHTGAEILEQQEFPSMYIPIVPSYGNQYWLDTERRIFGAVRASKDAQRVYNYHQSNAVELHALAPRAPYIGAIGQFEGLEQDWITANTENKAYLGYKPVSVAGTIVGAPQRQQFAGVQSGTEALLQRSEHDIQAAFGQYAASLGAPSQERSGIAIREKKLEGETSNYHYIHNLSKSIEHAGYILLDMIPRIYSDRRALRILGEDGEPRSVNLDQTMPAASNHAPRRKASIFNLNVGHYDLIVSVGPGYATRRQESVESMISLAQADPKVMQIADDLIVRNMDWPGADQIAERLKRTIPPEIKGEEEGEAADPRQAQQQQAMQQMQQMQQDYEGQLAELQARLESKEASQAMEMDIKMFDAKTKRYDAETKRLELQMKAAECAARAENLDTRTDLLVVDAQRQAEPPDNGRGGRVGNA